MCAPDEEPGREIAFGSKGRFEQEEGFFDVSATSVQGGSAGDQVSQIEVRCGHGVLFQKSGEKFR